MIQKSVEELEEEIKALKKELERENLCMKAERLRQDLREKRRNNSPLQRAINWVKKTWEGF